MDFAPIIAGFNRVVTQDLLALGIVLVLFVVQLIIFGLATRYCRVPLLEASASLAELAGIHRQENVSLARRREVLSRSYNELRDTWEENISDIDTGVVARRPLDPEVVFSPDSLLPGQFNSRLDLAAPGVFTGLGIFGTFIGLIVGFLRVNPDVATESVSPLLGGMVVAFVNSALGVGLSLRWVWTSRRRRHEFDTAVHNLVRALRRRITFIDPDDALRVEVGQLAKATEESATTLAATLGPQLEKTFAGLVSTPFEQLTTTVQSFEVAMRASAAQQEAVQGSLDAGVTALNEAHGRVTQVVQEVRSVLDDLGLAGLRLQEAVTATQIPLERASQIASQTGQLVGSLENATRQQAETTTAMSNAASSLNETASGLQAHSAGFSAATERLVAAVATIQQATDRAVGATVEAAREELRVAIVELRDGLAVETQRTIAAYGTATQGIVAAVDEQMSDLTERLQAELSTLTARLPAEVEQVHSAMRQFREQIGEALRSINEAVRQLRQEAPAVLQRQLDGYDEALAKAVDHFNGTLSSWNGNVEAIAALARQLDGLRQISLATDGPRKTETSQ